MLRQFALGSLDYDLIYGPVTCLFKVGLYLPHVLLYFVFMKCVRKLSSTVLYPEQ